ncbi:MAG: 50S ribosomal protein L15 [Chlamydiales bacterium]|nr:50S ribosomal protein L15 [Chlamydiales bacterium]
MSSLHTLENTTRPFKKRKRVGRGLGSGTGKTCGRGEKGAGSRSGYKRRHTYEGGQFRLFMKLPQRGFNNARFRTEYEVINLGQIDTLFNNGDTVNLQTLRDRGVVSGNRDGIKLLGDGELTKKLTIEVDVASQSAQEKLTKSHSTLKLLKK